MRNIEVRLSNRKGKFDRFANFCVGAGRAHEALRTGFVRQLETAVRECGFRYLRFHGLFCDDMAVVRRVNGRLVYNWQYIDEVFDEMLALGIRPFVELSFMPRAMASGDRTLFWWRGNITPPSDYDEYYDFLHAAVTHWQSRYDQEELKAWFFEVWNEPDLAIFFSGDMAEYFKMYDTAARAVKDVCADYRVGGPATSEHHWIEEMIGHCLDTGIPIDFLSTHTYGVEGAVDEFGVDLHILLDDPDYIPSSVAATRARIDATPLAGIPLYYTEWSSSYTSRDNLHDSYINAPYILYNLKRLSGSADAMSYWTFTDIFEEAGPPPTPFHGGFGLMNMHGLKKPPTSPINSCICSQTRSFPAATPTASYAAAKPASRRLSGIIPNTTKRACQTNIIISVTLSPPRRNQRVCPSQIYLRDAGVSAFIAPAMA